VKIDDDSKWEEISAIKIIVDTYDDVALAGVKSFNFDATGMDSFA